MYVGKAKNLRQRVAQYKQLKGLGPWKEKLVAEAVDVKHQVLSSEIEAIFVEADLIKRYQPLYNIRQRDDKSPIYIVITKEEFPRVLTARQTDLDKPSRSDLRGASVIGPFQSAYMLKQVLRVVRPSFRWCNQRIKPADKPCFYYHLGLCSGACVGEISAEEYRSMIERLKKFFRGQTKTVQRELKEKIKELAAVSKFEAAARLKNQYQEIEQLVSPQFKLSPDVALPKLQSAYGRQAVDELTKLLQQHFGLPEGWRAGRIEGYDVSNYQGKYAVVSLVTFLNGQPAKKFYRQFHIRSKQTPDDYAMLQEALHRRQKHPEWGWPDVILVDGGQGQLSKARQAFAQDYFSDRVGNLLTKPVIISIGKRPDRLFLPPVLVALPTRTAAKIEENTEENNFKNTASHSFITTGHPPTTINRPLTKLPVSRLGEVGRLLQHIRDESHRFARKHTRRRLLSSVKLT